MSYFMRSIRYYGQLLHEVGQLFYYYYYYYYYHFTAQIRDLQSERSNDEWISRRLH